ncbi:MAG TPA: TerC family protein [Kofleriaceae bacterium]|nr:TerC family protein [Kofleriaceae bacterium]
MWDFSIFQSSDTWIALLTLTVMEVVLGIDNIVFISILTDKLPAEKQERTRRLGVGLALILRLALLFTITWIMQLTAPLFSVFGNEVSGRDLVLGLGGLFLIAKATHEIYSKIEVGEESEMSGIQRRAASVPLALAQILLLDVVFSLDSVITAVGMAQHIEVMVIATVVAVIVMLFFVNRISKFVNQHPSMKMLALSFLLLIGVVLVADALDQHIDKGYIYFAMAFSLAVELINLRVRKRARKKRAPAKPALHDT